MRRLLLVAALAGALAGAAAPARAQTPAPGPEATTGIDTHGTEKEDLEAQPPIQSYYHRAFFGEPWRTPDAAEKAMTLQSGGVLGAAVAVGLFLAWRRRRYDVEAARP